MSPPPPQILVLQTVHISSLLRVRSFLSLRAYEALVLTHELQDIDRMDCYLSEVLYPLTPLLVFGRSAKAFPAEKNDKVVFDWWKDRCRKLVLS